MGSNIKMMDLKYAKHLDTLDPLRTFREKFHIPKNKSETGYKDSIYLCGNSLGLQPKTVRYHIERELKKWEENGVESQLEGKQEAWVDFDEVCVKQMASLVGAKDVEVTLMNSLTVNLHLMLAAFYNPTETRFKIIVEKGAFPSDLMAISSHLKLKGFCPNTSLLPIGSREGEQHISEEDIYSLLDSKEGEEVCLILLGGVNYLTGQVLDMKNISKKAKEKGVTVGFDLAHAVGNIELKLHEWETDFAVWCTYKYLNSGPGGIGGCFVHEKHANDFTIPRLSGWWAHDKNSRFLMGSSLELQEGAFGFQISNPPILCLASLRASLDIYEEAGMKAFTEKSKLLTDYLESLLIEKLPESVNIITPSDSGKRGCQLSLTLTMGRKVLKLLKEKGGIICDFREPNFIRVAPNPLYNTFADVWNFVNILSELLCQSDE